MALSWREVWSHLSKSTTAAPAATAYPLSTNPIFLEGAAREQQISPGDRVMGVSHNGVAKAYPIAILDYHEVVNDRFGDTALTITFCPLCGTGMAFFANAASKDLNFGVSGLIYNSNVLLYDQATQSLWSEVMKKAVTGPLQGTTLTQVPAQFTTWGSWLQQYLTAKPPPRTLMAARQLLCSAKPHNFVSVPLRQGKSLQSAPCGLMAPGGVVAVLLDWS